MELSSGQIICDWCEEKISKKNKARHLSVCVFHKEIQEKKSNVIQILRGRIENMETNKAIIDLQNENETLKAQIVFLKKDNEILKQFTAKL
jgi:hypothetical protein